MVFTVFHIVTTSCVLYSHESMQLVRYISGCPVGPTSPRTFRPADAISAQRPNKELPLRVYTFMTLFGCLLLVRMNSVLVALSYRRKGRSERLAAHAPHPRELELSRRAGVDRSPDQFFSKLRGHRMVLCRLYIARQFMCALVWWDPRGSCGAVLVIGLRAHDKAIKE